ncbi:hypothetical protein F0Q45_04995 [Mycobacterium simiae]|uniref:Uncharacterized protein n=1 Tax=Mycobacterium simiae TaxID=1784 RepID=A0A5B1BVT4_MYCSI|nr:hypothetical protein [Mycobacterium simiae]KAA1251334.1 hypothetical protein F0Q45_04995 [Mycobacterium simiae]
MTKSPKLLRRSGSSRSTSQAMSSALAQENALPAMSAFDSAHGANFPDDGVTAQNLPLTGV